MRRAVGSAGEMSEQQPTVPDLFASTDSLPSSPGRG